MRDLPIEKYRGLLPMIATPGAPTRAQIREVLLRYRSAGIRQFLFFGRAGCEYAYLSDQWMQMCADFIEQAGEFGMGVWLYDDYNCPTTIVNGQLPALGPDYQAKFIHAWLDQDEFRQEWFTNPNAGDMLSDQAIDYFLASTYDAYAARFQAYFGHTVRGIFSDEPTQAVIGKDAVWSGHLRLPAFVGIENEYTSQTGRPLSADLEAALRGRGPDDLWPVYWRLIGQKSRHYLDRLREWCDRHQLHLTGHLYDEHDSDAAVYKNGDPLLVLDGFSFPGMDEIFTETSLQTAEWVTLGLVQQAIRNHPAGGMAELLSLGPCDMPPAKMRQMIWLTALFNVDNYLIAVAQLNAKGNSTRGSFYGPCNLLQPNFALHALLAQDAEKAALIARKASRANVLVRFPQSWSARRAAYQTAKPVYGDINELRLLLATLTDRQFAWQLIGEDEAVPDPDQTVIGIDQRGYLCNDRHFTLEELLRQLEQSVGREVTVTSRSGELSHNLCVRTFTDHSCAVLDLNQDETERHYYLCQGQRVRSFNLNGRGIALFEPVMEIEPSWRIAYDQPNLLRFDLSAQKREVIIRCLDEIPAVKLLVRQHDGTPSLRLDDQAVIADQVCTALPPGFAELYRETSRFALTAGEHRLQLMNDCPEYPYLPGVFLSGSISVFPDLTIRNGMPDFQYGRMPAFGLPNYVGKIILTGRIQLPDHPAINLHVDTGSYYTELSVNGQALGGKAWAPYAWVIPAEYAGQAVDLQVTMATSFGPLFGDLDHLDGVTMKFVSRQIPNRANGIGLLTPPWLTMER